VGAEVFRGHRGGRMCGLVNKAIEDLVVGPVIVGAELDPALW
jgi:hypothetical protein